MSFSCPLFLEVTKIVKDLFDKGYYFDRLRLDIRTKASPGVEFSFGGIKDLITKKVVGSIEARYKFKEQGLTFIERWNTNNVLGTEVHLEDYCEGVKMSCETYFVPIVRRKSDEEVQADGGRSGPQIWAYSDKKMKLTGSYKNPLGRLNIESDFRSGMQPNFKAGVSANFQGFFVGCGGVFDHNTDRIKEHVVGGGFSSGEISGMAAVKNFKDLLVMCYYRMTDSLETGVMASTSLDGKYRNLGLACKYFIDDDTAVRLKVSDKAELGIGFSQRLNSSVTVFLSALVNSSNAMLTGSFHMGFCLELTA